ncbi:unnamed protein product [Timema podura]|uniref:Uncharacterized protein n=1 Tax=Timema podura TaxID=61482 RepID=A0ABN7NKF7_TIMPD|nr:unnamed protein product [Timema podura]
MLARVWSPTDLLIREKFMSGKILLCWRHELTSDIARKRYLPNQDTLRSTHSDIAYLFFSEFAQHGSSELDEHSAPALMENKQTPFQTTLQEDDVTYSQRHVEESWIHLLKGGDRSRLKQLTVCNFDFLLAAVQMVSVSYLRCVLEHVRCYLLDRDLELVYYTVRKSSDVLTRDPLQLAAQVICWLRQVADGSGDLVSPIISAAMAWCDGYTAPLLVPLNGWLQPPLPLQIKNVHCPSGVKLIEPTPSGQHIIVVPPLGDPQLWHVMSNTLSHTFKEVARLERASERVTEHARSKDRTVSIFQAPALDQLANALVVLSSTAEDGEIEPRFGASSSTTNDSYLLITRSFTSLATQSLARSLTRLSV